MGLSKFEEIIPLSMPDISDNIQQTENQLSTLRFRKATLQKVDSHEIKKAKRRIAQLKTLLRFRLQDLEKKRGESDSTVTGEKSQ